MSIELLQKEAVLLLYDDKANQSPQLAALKYLGMTDIDAIYVGEATWQTRLQSKHYAVIIYDLSHRYTEIQPKVFEDLYRANIIRLSRLFILISELTEFPQIQHFLAKNPPDIILTRPYSLDMYVNKLREQYPTKVRFKSFYESFEKGDYHNVLMACEKRIQGGGDRETLLECFRLQAMSYLFAQQFDAAKKLCNMLSKQQDQLLWLNLVHGLACLESGELGQAKRDFYKVLKQEKDDIKALDGLCEVLVQTKQLSQAHRVLSHRMALTPFDEAKQQQFIDLSLTCGNFAAAEQAIYSMMENHHNRHGSTDPESWLQLLLLLREQIKSDQDVFKAYDRVLEVMSYVDKHEKQNIDIKISQCLVGAEIAESISDIENSERFSKNAKINYDSHLFLLDDQQEVEVGLGFYRNNLLQGQGEEILKSLLWRCKTNDELNGELLVKVCSVFNGQAYLGEEANTRGVEHFYNKQYADASRLLDLATQIRPDNMAIHLNAVQALLSLLDQKKHVNSGVLVNKMAIYLEAIDLNLAQATDKQSQRYHRLLDQYNQLSIT
ncbi:hypothetical protein AVI51_00115 [Piscirickettsia salmonis]|uniref:PEP-CTERM system TPR-repeat lipoprotein n=1 Tax=Piscirickettsia salmonis TaxID=1238 RepID=A0A9Q5VLR5_PISSA|nr:hypothetical protein [Piscirickettsia salmonis]ALA24449.1 response regulator [Piscirickettsia salmonis]APS44811.1 hypothetical protein AVI48_10845 [Piscirickettsia salmonis]APS48170.1 hypothetical protein AVI49_11450 [Piscirickettsia salmonis]APS49440.1 hypothetical protein AVI50_00135 [Piscirickettsia salmonis]APS52618.1 hypothetical protein AVI51_00115 [Piscirickettsia salmonis]